MNPSLCLLVRTVVRPIAFCLIAAALPAIAQTSLATAAPFFQVSSQPVLTGLVHLPGLLVTEADTVLLIAQSRVAKRDSDPSDVVVTRSLDQGLTWSAPVKLFASGSSGRIGYSCMLVEDRRTKPHTVLAYYTLAPTPWKPAQLVWYGRRSTNEGADWSEPFLVKSDGRPESKPSNGGHGFQLSSGRLVIPGRGNFLYSDDGGESWTTAGKAETPETKVVSVVTAEGREPDAVYLITRKSTKYRIYGGSDGKLLEEGDHKNTMTTLGRNPGLARYSTKRDDTANVLLMSGLHDMKGHALSITYSLDEGRTWSHEKPLGEQGWYSDLGVTRNKTIIAAYTVGFSSNLKVARFNLPWVMQGQAVATIARDADPIRVVCLGDSITYGTRSANPATDSYPAQLQALLGAGFVVKNLGVGGATFWHGGGRNASQQLPAAKQFAPQVAIVMFGVNDSRGDNGNWSHFSEAELDAASVLDALLAQTPRPRILLCLPTSSAPELPGLTPERIKVLQDRVPHLDAIRAKLTALAQRYAAQGVELVDMDAATAKHPELHSADAVHFTAEGYHFIAETLRPRVLAAADPAPR